MIFTFTAEYLAMIFWDYFEEIGLLCLHVLPSITAKTSLTHLDVEPLSDTPRVLLIPLFMSYEIMRPLSSVGIIDLFMVGPSNHPSLDLAPPQKKRGEGKGEATYVWQRIWLSKSRTASLKYTQRPDNYSLAFTFV